MKSLQKIFVVKSLGLNMALLSVAICLCGCSKPREFTLGNELCPTNIAALLDISTEELEHVDIGRMNLLCADAAACEVSVDVGRYLRKLDEWAEGVRRAEIKYRTQYERDPLRYDNSYAKFKAVNLILTVKEDFKCRYQMPLVKSGELYNVNSPAFFRNYDDVFISGLLGRRRGTCSSYAPLIVALGRRLGYPLYLKATRNHLFCYWDDGKETFNLDTNGDGVDTPDDAFYLNDVNQGIVGMSKSDFERERLMCPMSAADCLSSFLEIAGFCHEANGRYAEAQKSYRMALKYRPGAVDLTRLAMRQLAVPSNR